MRQIRLLPLVMVAVAGLLLVKVIGVMTGQGYVLSGVQTTVAQEASPEAEAPANEIGQEAVDKPVEEEDPSEVGTEDTGLRNDPKEVEQVVVDSSERVLLGRLSERRIALDKLEDDLAMQRDLIEAAEKRVEERFALLEALEAKIDVALKQKTEQDSAQFLSLVSMYELMKPADAAEIFNSLNMHILVRIVRGMKARKMAEVLARMTSERAEALTIELANYSPERRSPGAADDLSNLPQIVGE